MTASRRRRPQAGRACPRSSSASSQTAWRPSENASRAHDPWRAGRLGRRIRARTIGHVIGGQGAGRVGRGVQGSGVDAAGRQRDRRAGYGRRPHDPRHGRHRPVGGHRVTQERAGWSGAVIGGPAKTPRPAARVRPIRQRPGDNGDATGAAKCRRSLDRAGKVRRIVAGRPFPKIMLDGTPLALSEFWPWVEWDTCGVSVSRRSGARVRQDGAILDC